MLGYGSLAGGLLAGKFKKIPEFEDGDNRKKFYPYYNPETWDDLQQFIDVLREIASSYEKPVAHVAINWCIQQPGVTCALVGARNIAQAESNAAAAEWELTDDELDQIDSAYAAHIAGKLTQLSR